MKNVKIEITESEALFVHYTLKQYASTMDREDRPGILEIANKFKVWN